MSEQRRCSMNVGHDANSWTAPSSPLHWAPSIQLLHNWVVGMAGKWVRERVLMLVDQARMDSVVSASLGSLRDTAASLRCEAHLAQGCWVCDSALTALGASPGLEPQKLSPRGG